MESIYNGMKLTNVGLMFKDLVDKVSTELNP